MAENKAHKIKDEPIKLNGKTIGTRIFLDNGKDFDVLNPHGKYVKINAELEKGYKLTNRFEVKKDEKGKKQKLTQKEIAFKKGYRGALIDEANAYKAKQKEIEKNNKSKDKKSFDAYNPSLTKSKLAVTKYSNEELVKMFPSLDNIKI